MAHFIGEECVACGTCAEECPVEAIEKGEPYVIDENKCTDCGSCSEVCPVEAIAEKQAMGRGKGQVNSPFGTDSSEIGRPESGNNCLICSERDLS